MNELTAEDCSNIAKWISAASSAYKMGLRGPIDESEQKTWRKITMHAMKLRATRRPE